MDYWKIAGGWMQEERAEYRLAMSLLKADAPKEAKVHAERCEAICLQNGGDAFELFYAHDLLMQVHFNLASNAKNNWMRRCSNTAQPANWRRFTATAKSPELMARGFWAV